MKFKLVTNLGLAAIVLFAMTISVFAASSNEIEKHWAAPTLQKWIEQGLLKGYTDGQIKPDAPITRAEFAALLNRALGLKDEASQMDFIDLPTTYWGYKDIAIAYQAGYIKGDSNKKVNPNQNTSRQEAAVMLAGVLQLQGAAEVDLSQFKDADAIAKWGRMQVAALAERSIMRGDATGKFRPLDSISRAEAVVAIDNALKSAESTVQVFDQSGEYGSVSEQTVIYGNVAITAPDVTLVNYVIKGNLLLGEEIGEGDVYLKQVTVEGTTTVAGGGQNSVHVEDSVLVQIVVDKRTGTVRIVVSGATIVQKVTVQSSVKLEESNVTDSGFRNIELSDVMPQNSTVDLIGQFESVHVLAVNLTINVPSGSIDEFEVAQRAEGSSVRVGKEATIVSLVLDTVAKIMGEGKVQSATVNEGATGSSFETQPDNVDGAGSTPVVVPPMFSGGGGGGGNPGGGGGGNPGGGNPGDGSTPGNTCSSDCNNAFLSLLKFGDYTLVQRNENRSNVGEGFNRSILEYTVEIPRDVAAGTIVPLTVSAESSSAVVSVQIQYQSGESVYQPLSDSNTVNVELQPLEDVHIFIYVNSGDTKYSKSYAFHIYYPRTVQEAFKLNVNQNYEETGIYQLYYSLNSNSFENTDIVKVYTSKEDRVLIRECGSVLYGGIQCSLGSAMNIEDIPQQYYVQVIRDGEVLIEGEYTADFTPIAMIEDNSGIDISMYTREELEEVTRMWPGDYSYGIKRTINQEQFPEALRNAKYMSERTVFARGYYSHELEQVINDNVKMGTNIYHFNEIPIYGGVVGSFSTEKEIIYDQYFQIVFFDENRKPIGVYTKLIQFDEDHVAAGVTLVKKMKDPNDTESPILSATASVIFQYGTSHLTSSEDGVVYAIPATIDMTDMTREQVHQIVQNGQGTALLAKAGVPIAVHAYNLGLGTWNVIASDASENLSNVVGLIIVDKPEWFQYLEMAFNNRIGFVFSNQVELTIDEANLKAAISFSQDNGRTFAPLSEEDEVTVNTENYEVRINVEFAAQFTESVNMLKIKAGTIKVADEVYDHDFFSHAFSAIRLLELQSSNNTFRTGELITFKVDSPGNVYLVPADTFGSSEYYDQLVSMGEGKVVVVSEDKTGQPLDMETVGLPSGKYWLYAWNGQILEIYIAE